MGDLALRIEGAAKVYGHGERAVPVFEGLELEVAHRETVALLGPSGCGKSTLLRAVAGLEALSAGRIRIAPPPDAAQAGLPVGLAFQNPHLFPWLTVRQNVALGHRFRANRTARG